MTLLDEAQIPHDLSSRGLRVIGRLLGLIFVSILLIPQVKTYAQDNDDIDTVRVRTDLVAVPVYVTQSNGQRVENLNQTDFELRDNGNFVKIQYFVTGTERIALAFLLDASGSVRDVVSRQREVAVALLSRFGHESEVAVVQFAEKARTISPFSRDLNVASRAFEATGLENHRTAIFDALESVLRMFDVRQSIVAERRIIVLISDGLDNVSVVRPRDVVEAARKRGVSVYAIQIPLFTPQGGQLRPRAASRGFRDIAEKSGGKFFLAGQMNSPFADKSSYDLSPIFKAIEDDLRGQYLLAYYPETEPQNAQFHRIDVRLTSKVNTKLRVHLLRQTYTFGAR